MNRTSIEWTDATWNPTRGCSRVSPGCVHCYAERQAGRFALSSVVGLGDPLAPFDGFVKPTADGSRWTGRVELMEHRLLDPLRWRRPRRIFVDSMSDLFHEGLPDEAIDRVFAVMALCPQHEFYVLTKRAERMAAWWSKPVMRGRFGFARHLTLELAVRELVSGDKHGACPEDGPGGTAVTELMRGHGLPNVRLGVSVEDQPRAGERLPHLMRVAERGWPTMVSAEPLLGPIKMLGCELVDIGWLIIGGESGPHARPCDVAWIRSLRDQAQAAGVPCFVKQVGSRPDGWWTNSLGPRFNRHAIEHPKGGDPAEWPDDLRVREWPA